MEGETMNAILDLGVQINLYFQSLGGWLKTPMGLLSFMGTELFYLAIIPAIYWCWSVALGIRVGLLLMLSSGINSIAKLALHQPRPYWYDLRVKGLAAETSFGVPSGHAQNAVVVWGSIAAWIRRPWAWILAILLILSIGLSRIYLGVHFPTDVLAGWLLGALILIGYLWIEQPTKEWLIKQSILVQIVTAFLVSISLILLTYFARLLLGNFNLPQEWVANAQQTFPGSEPIDPLSITGIFSNAGVFFGMALGAILLFHRGGLDTSGPWWQRLLRYLLGLAGVVILYFGLSLLFPHGDDWPSNILRYIRYGFVGLWVTWLAPLLFFAFKLAKPKTRKRIGLPR